jgi:hypothetical protein
MEHRRPAIILSITFVMLLAAGAVVLAFAMRPTSSTGVAHAASNEPERITLPPGEKLEGVSWACPAAGWCAPTWVTRLMRPEERPETHTLRNKDGFSTYVFVESAAPSQR